MADVVNKQKKTRAQRKKTYYAAQFARTEKNKRRNKTRAENERVKAQLKKERRAARA